MATCGEYELEKAIGWGRRATCFAARVSGAGGESTIVIRRARSAERAISQAFFRAAAEQQTAVGAGCRRLAPILSFERDESGFAFYATTRYETSLADFLEADCKVDGVLLRENVTSLLGALRELHEKSRRAHGNLTPGNILLDPHGRIFLTDLAPSAKDATAADDLFALGMLIYQLVRRTARIGTLNPPLDYSPAWTDSLGDEAAGWLAFTNRLLDKPRNASPDAIKTAIDDLSDLKKLAILAEKEAQTQVKAKGDGPKDIIDPPRAKKRSPLPKVIAIILLLAGGGGGYVWYKGKKAAEEKRRIIAEETRRIEILNATLPPAVKDLPAKLTQLPKEIRDKGKILGDGTLDSRLSRIVESLNNGSWTRSNIEDHLRNWPLPGELQAKAAKWKDAPHQWTALARNLEAAANISLDRDESLVEQALTAIAISKEASDLDIQWEDIARTLKDLSDQKNQIPSLPEFTPWAENEIRNVSDLKKAPDRAQATLKALRVLLAFLKSDSGSRVRWESFDKKILEVPTIELMPDWPNQWRQEAERLVVPEKKTRDEWDKYLAKIEAQIPGLPAKERPDWQKKLDDSRALAAGAMESQIALVEKDLLKFRGMRTQIERARDQYTVFLGKWKPKVAALDKDDKEAKKKATDLREEFRKETDALLKDYPEYRLKLASAGLVNEKDKGKVYEMGEALATKDKINLQFSNPEGWTDITAKDYDPNAARFLYTKGGIKTQMYFLALDKDYAMAAWETPLILARLSGAPSLPPRDGPQIRRGDFFPASEWLWKSPTDLLQEAKGPRSYFAQGVTPGDLGNDYCPATWLTFDEAKGMAEALGGQLPTVDQWKKAYEKAGKEKRLRSAAAWSKQYPLLTKWQEQTGNTQSASGPDIGSFSRGIKIDDHEAAKDANPDGKLWLAMAADGNWQPKSGFTHLIGNAAEWVDNNGTHAVIGGSVVSPPTLPTNIPVPITEKNASFFDVTFRLVVPLAPGGAGVGVEKFMNIAKGLDAP